MKKNLNTMKPHYSQYLARLLVLCYIEVTLCHEYFIW